MGTFLTGQMALFFPSCLVDVRDRHLQGRERSVATTLLLALLGWATFLSLPRGIWAAAAAISFAIGSLLAAAHVVSLPATRPGRASLVRLALGQVALAIAVLWIAWPAARSHISRLGARITLLEMITRFEQHDPPRGRIRLAELRDCYARADLHADGIRYFNRLASRSIANTPAEFERRWASAILMGSAGRTNDARLAYEDLTRRFHLLPARHLRLSPSSTDTISRGSSSALPQIPTVIAANAWSAPELGATRFPGFLDVGEHSRARGEPSSGGAVYARLVLVSSQSIPLRIATGSNDDLTMWWNGDLVVRKNANQITALDRIAALDSEVVMATLKVGTNVLLTRVGNLVGESGLLIRITDRNRRPIPGLTFPESDPKN